MRRLRMDVRIESAPLAPRSVEVVEHKGIGHPDTICDALAESLGVALCRHYRERFGAILHHNVDKALLVGGRARPRFGGGEVLAPIEVYLAGRATHEVRGERVPVDEIADAACRGWLRRSLHALDPDRHVRLRVLVRPGSEELVDLFLAAQRTGRALANDTSIGAGHAPASPLERAVLAVADRLRRASADPASPEVGEDVKIMAVRAGDRAELTVACAMIDRSLADAAAYAAAVDRVRRLATDAARAELPGPVEVRVNAADDPARGAIYLTVTGTSAEAGDDGQVGRGNRVGGLITPYRPMSLEAAAGKNPVSHVGKLYAVVARELAARIVRELPEVAEAECVLVSRIGAPVDDPSLVHVRVATRAAPAPAAFHDAIERVAREELARIAAVTERIVGDATRAPLLLP